MLPVDVRKSDTSILVKNAGVNKQLADNQQLRNLEEKVWLLLYPDMDIVDKIPGSTEEFTVEKYKDELGRPYSRVNLYICNMLHFEGKDCYKSITSCSLIVCYVFAIGQFITWSHHVSGHMDEHCTIALHAHYVD